MSKIRMVFGTKDEIEVQLGKLRSDNYDLMEIRKQRQSIVKKVDKISDDALTGFFTVPIVHKAFKTLATTLVTTWSCNNSHHDAHSMHLSLNVKESFSGDCVCSNLVLTYQQPNPNGQKAIGDKESKHLLLQAMRANEDKRQTLGFKRATTTMCEHLTRCTCAGDLLLGRLTTLQNDHQADLYHGDVRCAEAKKPAPAVQEVRLDEALGWFQDPVDKYELAQKLATAVLHLHDTPWLPDTWRLNSITTLHASEPFDATQALTVAMPLCVVSNPTVIAPKGDSEDYYVSGVLNATLFRLGVALLEIEHGISLETCKVGGKCESDFVAARRLAARPDTLAGRRYRLLARKCLNCNFGCEDNDLASEELQQAFYGGVIHKLRGLVAAC